MIRRVVENLKEIQRKEKAVSHWLSQGVDIHIPTFARILHKLDLITTDQRISIKNKALRIIHHFQIK